MVTTSGEDSKTIAKKIFQTGFRKVLDELAYPRFESILYVITEATGRAHNSQNQNKDLGDLKCRSRMGKRIVRKLLNRETDDIKSKSQEVGGYK